MVLNEEGGSTGRPLSALAAVLRVVQRKISGL
jgi:hypothetical protein